MGNFRPLFRRYFRHFLTGNTSLKLPMTGFEVGSSIVWINLSANCATARVTRFGEISPLWQNFKSLWAIFLMVHLLFCKILVQLWHFYAIGQIVIVVNGQRLNSYIATWSPGLATKFTSESRQMRILLTRAPERFWLPEARPTDVFCS